MEAMRRQISATRPTCHVTRRFASDGASHRRQRKLYRNILTHEWRRRPRRGADRSSPKPAGRYLRTNEPAMLTPKVRWLPHLPLRYSGNAPGAPPTPESAGSRPSHDTAYGQRAKQSFR